VTKQILLQRSTITANDFVYRVLEKMFGNKGTIRACDPAVIFGKPHQIISELNREPFVSRATERTITQVQELTHNLVSFSPSWVDQSPWERVANVSVDPSANVAEANLFPLIRYFVGEIACGILMGQDFMNNNPNVLADLFTIDGSFNKFLAGFPWWFPGMAPAYQARSRFVQAVREHQEALYAVRDGRDPGSCWSDMSDVSNVMVDRARQWRDMGVEPDIYSTADAGILWALNANSNQAIFWVIWYIYSQPTLLAQIRGEIAPFVQLTARPPSGLPIPEPPKLTLNLDGLIRSCPLFKATFFETLRLKSPSTSIKAVTETFSVTESAEDAMLDGKSEPQTYRFERGSYICIPHGVHQMDERYWKDPKTFNPRRFFVDNNNNANENIGDEKEQQTEREKTKSTTTVDMGTMRVFGGGSTMCKGRNFAEREVLAFVAGVLTVWDIQPVEGKWRDLGGVVGAGMLVPKRDVRVRLKRRGVGE
jgi:Cytochrome P450